MTIDAVVAKEEIRDVIARYTRGIDRMDRELILSCYHPTHTTTTARSEEVQQRSRIRAS